MVCVCSPRVRWALLLALLVCVFAQDSSRECLDKDELIAEMPSAVDLPTECVLTCTALTYRQILDTQRRVTVRFRDSRPGKSVCVCACAHVNVCGNVCTCVCVE